MSPNSDIIFFDGICILCNKWVQWVLKRDKKKRFKFSSLQSEFSQNFISDPKIRATDSIVFYHEGRFSVKSKAVLGMLSRMGFPYNLTAIFKLIPGFISDKVYDWVAAHRYKWFGKRDSCMIPQEPVKDRFLE